MSIVSFIVVAMALGLADMLLMRRCADAVPVRLSAGLLIAASMATVQVLFLLLGTRIGDFLRLQSANDPLMYADINAYIFLGITVAVAVKMYAPYLRRKTELPVFDLRRAASVAGMAAATGIDVLLLGIGIGFVAPDAGIHTLVWPLWVGALLLGYLGMMFGRQHVQLRPRRWMTVACVMLLGVAIAATYNATH